MRGWALGVFALLILSFAIGLSGQEGIVGQDLTVYIGVVDSHGRQDAVSACNATLYYPNHTLIFANYSMINTAGSMLRNLTITANNFTSEGTYLAVSRCNNSGTGLAGDVAFEIKMVEKRVTRVVTVSGTAINSTGDAISGGTAVSYFYSCGTSMASCLTLQGVAEATSITNGTYAMQFERQVYLNEIYKVVTNVTGSGQSINVTTFFNS